MQRISINNFKAIDDMTTFRSAAKYLRENPDTVLVLEKKTYLLRDEEACALQRKVMRGDFTRNPEHHMFNPKFKYVIGIDLKGAKNVKIEGNGATLIFDGFMENISCQYCENVEISDIIIDLFRKAYTKGKIIKSGKILGALPYIDADFGNLSLLSHRMPTLRMILNDTVKKRFVSVTGSFYAIRLSKSKFRFLGAMIRKEAQGADYVYLTNTYHYRPSILIYEAVNTRIINVTIHSHCGMGIVGHRSKDILLSGLKVMPSEGEAMSTNTDATHFVSCSGLLRYENCYFEGHGDDASNVHTYYHTISSSEGNKCKLILKAPTWTHSQKLDYFYVGDTIELCKFEDLTPTDIYKVVSVKPDFDNLLQEVEFDKPLPINTNGYVMADVTQLPRLEFVNSKVFNHIARAILVKTRNVLIEGNTLDAHSFTGIHVAAEAYWREGVSSQNVIIRNNKILNYAIGINVEISAEKPHLPIHKNISILNNLIETTGENNGIIARCVDGLTIKDNVIHSVKEPVFVQYCENVIIE